MASPTTYPRCSLVASRGAASGRFGPPRQVSIAGQPVNEPALAVGPGGTAAAIWSDDDYVHASIAPPGGQFGVPENASRYEYSFYSAIGFDAHDLPTAVWSAGDERDSAALRFARRSPRGGFRAPRTLATGPPDFVGFPFFGWHAVAVAGERPLAAWESEADSGNTQIGAYSGGVPQLLTTETPQANGVYLPVLAASQNGMALAAWTHTRGQSRSVEVSIRPPGGAFGPVTQVSDSGETAGSPAVAIDDQGRGVVAWNSGQGVRAVTLQAGSGFEPARTLSLPDEVRYPTAAVDRRGHAVVAWETASVTRAAIFTWAAR
jgi:hypothetical protein